MKRLTLLILALLPLFATGRTPIFGKSEVDADAMYGFVCRHNPNFDRTVAEAFHEIGRAYGIRGDIAFCQAIIETGWFRFDNGTAVSPSAHNYCGLGVSRRGDRGCEFDTVEDGVRAMIQHLYAYASRAELPEGEYMVDPRFKYVRRGCAPTWESLAGKWAMNSHYGTNILRIFGALTSHAEKVTHVEYIGVDIPDFLLDSPESDDESEADPLTLLEYDRPDEKVNNNPVDSVKTENTLIPNDDPFK